MNMQPTCNRTGHAVTAAAGVTTAQRPVMLDFASEQVAAASVAGLPSAA